MKNDKKGNEKAQQGFESSFFKYSWEFDSRWATLSREIWPATAQARFSNKRAALSV